MKMKIKTVQGLKFLIGEETDVKSRQQERNSDGMPAKYVELSTSRPPYLSFTCHVIVLFYFPYIRCLCSSCQLRSLTRHCCNYQHTASTILHIFACPNNDRSINRFSNGIKIIDLVQYVQMDWQLRTRSIISAAECVSRLPVIHTRFL